MSRIFLLANTNSTSVTFTDGTIWQGGIAPASGDEVHILNAALKFDLTLNFSGILLAKLVVYDSFTGALGGSGTNELQLGLTTGLFHVQAVKGQQGLGSPLININTGTNACDATVYGSRQPPGTDRNLMPTRLRGAHASNVLTVAGGFVGYAANSISQTGTLGTLNVTGANAHVLAGPGVTLASVNVAAGEVDVNTAVTTLNLSGGTIMTSGDWQMGTATLLGGRALFNHRYSSGTEVQNLKLQGGLVDLSQRGDAFVSTATSLRSGSVKQFAADQFSPGTLTLDNNGNRTLTFAVSNN